MSWFNKGWDWVQDHGWDMLVGSGVGGLLGGPVGSLLGLFNGMPNVKNWLNDRLGFDPYDTLLHTFPFLGNTLTANENLDFQKDVFNYQKGLQQTIFAREDSTMQRRVADLKAAGLSPVLASGMGAGTGAVVSPITPQRQNTAVDPLAIMGLMKMKADISRTVADEALINAQAIKTSVDTYGQNIQNNTAAWNLGLAQKQGISTNSSSVVKTIADSSNIIENALRNIGLIKDAKVDRSGRQNPEWERTQKILDNIKKMYDEYQK